MSMRPWISRTLIVTASFAACWTGAVWYWRATRRMPGADDLIIWLLLLPLLVLLMIWVAKKFIGGVGAATATAAAAVAPSSAAPAAVPPAVIPVAVLAGALRMPHGDDAATLAAALQAHQANPQLDPHLLDERGYPILSGRIAAIDGNRDDAMADWLRSHHGDVVLDDEVLRALTLGAAVADELCPDVDATALPLQLALLLPPEWSAPVQAAAAGWLRTLPEQRGWPAARIAMAPALHLTAALTGGAQPFMRLVIACGSRIGERSVQAWSDQSLLLDSVNPQGRIPAEGAAGVLLADQASAAAIEGDTGAVVLYPPTHAARGASADARGKIDSAVLARVTTQSLTQANMDAAGVTWIASDSDGRASRIGELLQMSGAVLPELDSDDVVALGRACGDAGEVGLVAALVLAQQQVRDGAAPAALCIGVLDPIERTAVLLAANETSPS